MVGPGGADNLELLVRARFRSRALFASASRFALWRSWGSVRRPAPVAFRFRPLPRSPRRALLLFPCAARFRSASCFARSVRARRLRSLSVRALRARSP